MNEDPEEKFKTMDDIDDHYSKIEIERTIKSKCPEWSKERIDKAVEVIMDRYRKVRKEQYEAEDREDEELQAD